MGQHIEVRFFFMILYKFPLHLARKLVVQMTQKNPILRIQIPQVLTSNFMMKHYYDDSIKELSEAKNPKSITTTNNLSKKSNKMIISMDLEEERANRFEEEKKLFEKENSSKNSSNSNSLFKIGSIENSLKPPVSHNQLNPVTSNNNPASTKDIIEAFRSANSLFFSNDELSVASGKDLMSMTLRSSFSLMSPMTGEKNRTSISFPQKFLNGKLHSNSSNSNPDKSKSSGSKSNLSSRKRSIRNGEEEDDWDEDSIISCNKYYEIFQDANPVPHLFKLLKVHFRNAKPSKPFT